jgi:hypothetical protein
MSDEVEEVEVVKPPVKMVNWVIRDDAGNIRRWGLSPEIDVPKEATAVDEPVEPPMPTFPTLSQESVVVAKRDQLLVESDWTQLGDAPVDKAAWAAYRTLLRDIPQQPRFPSDVVWPLPPPLPAGSRKAPAAAPAASGH